VKLRLNDNELSDAALRYRMIRWWGDVLEARSNLFMARRMAALATPSEVVEAE
jgi:hypothetical protein